MESSCSISSTRLSSTEQAALKRGNINTIEDLLLTAPSDIARRCKISPMEVNRLVGFVCNDLPPQPIRLLADVLQEGEEKFTTGDTALDDAIGGGIRTGMLWEIAGESAAGKTQLALQLSLSVQLPVIAGGLAGSTCYFSTRHKIPTTRLLEISETHDLISEFACGLDEVHTIITPAIHILLHVLCETLPRFIAQKSLDPASKPVKLIIIDALAELFHSFEKTTSSSLIERSRNISELSLSLHRLAHKHRIAILVLNEVVDTFDRSMPGEERDLSLYNEQVRWFNFVDGDDGEIKKQASLGLAWANQVNTRIILSRTGRRCELNRTGARPHKRLKTDAQATHHTLPVTTSSGSHLSLIRRLRVVFSSVSAPVSVDYVITTKGFSTVPQDDPTDITQSVSVISAAAAVTKPTVNKTTNDPGTYTIDPFTSTEETEVLEREHPEQVEIDGDEWDKLLVTDGSYDGIDWDALEERLTQQV